MPASSTWAARTEPCSVTTFGRGPSSIAACQLCAGVAAIETLKLLLGRGGVLLAPWGSQFDGYRMRYRQTWRPWGHRNPLQRLMIALVKAQLAAR